jgi:6-phosphogluconolactonase
MNPPRPALETFPDDEALAAAVAAGWGQRLSAARAAGRIHSIALSGGRISVPVFAAMCRVAETRASDLSAARFFWADERCVPPDHPDSNFLGARAGLLDPLRIPAAQVHRIRGEATPAVAAEEAARDLRRVAGGGPDAMPVLDLVLLGMGEDGHVASLFPGHAAVLADETSVFLPVFDSPKPPPVRVSLGMGALAAAREVWVLVAGAGKQQALEESLEPAGSTPLARLLQRRAALPVETTRLYISAS